jgi:GT2 family glycosyltransferase
MPLVSAVVVTYRSREVIPCCVRSLARCRQRFPFEAIVVDNASGDGTAEWIRERAPWITLIENERNEGFTRAVNAGIARARGSAVLLLNPDAAATPDGLDRLAGELRQDPSLAAVAPALAGPDFRTARSCGRFPTLWSLACDHLGLARAFPHTRLFGGYKYGERPIASLGDVDWASGAALLLSRAALERVGGLDEEIFMFMEEVDWCRRARAAGLGVRYLPGVRFSHFGQRSSAKAPLESYLHNVRARVHYFRKHHGAGSAWTARALLAASLSLKLLAVVPRAPVRARVYALALRAACEAPRRMAS